MRIKRFEIQGFKSFKDKTEIHFDHNITGIVGPNGCGKSNIVDAFFWVMGEQSYKHMRGSGSQDLIFNGSSKYAPLGIAEATLVLETTHVETDSAPLGATSEDVPLPSKKKEVSVTRRVHRDGEGEYFINGVPARLKDIHELFMDTGVGAKGYSVIEQGQIDKVVNAKPEDRRKLIEEAAGIAKYKARKKESLKKIEAAQSNLSRLNDVIQEIERNLGSLERQAQKAQKFLEYRGELIDKEVTWGKRKKNIIEKRIHTFRSESEILEQELIALKSEQSTSETIVETSRIEQLTLSKKMESLQEIVTELSQHLTREQSALMFSQKRQTELQKQIENQKSEKEILEKNIEQENLQIVQRNAELETIKEELVSLQSSLNDLQNELGSFQEKTENKKSHLEVTRKELYGLIQQTSSLNSKMAVLDSRIETSQTQVSKLLDEELQYKKDFEVASHKTNEIQKILIDLKSKKELSGLHFETTKKNLNEVNEALSQKRKLKLELLEKTSQKTATLKSLEELHKAYEGLAEGSKRVLEKSQTNENSKINLIADLLEVSAGYEGAVEAAFSNKIEDFFTSDFSEALGLITHLSDNELGKAAFHFAVEEKSVTMDEKVPQSIVEAFLASKSIQSHGNLLNFFEVKAEYQEIKNALVLEFSRFLLVEEIPLLSSEDFHELIAGLHGCALVTLNGMVLDSKGALRGGKVSGDTTAHLLARKSEIKKLQAELEVLLSQGNLISQEVLELEAKKLQNELTFEEIRNTLQSLDVELAGSEREFTQMNAKMEDGRQLYQKVQNEVLSLEELIQKSVSEKNESIELLGASQDRIRELEKWVAEVDSELALEIKQSKEQEKILETKRIQCASHVEKVNSIVRELSAAEKYIDDRKKRLTELSSYIEKLVEESHSSTGQDSEMTSKIEELTLQLSSQRDELSWVKNALEQTNTQMNEHLNRSREVSGSLEKKNKLLNQNTIELEKLNGELGFLIQNLEEKYGKDCFLNNTHTDSQSELGEPILTQEISEDEEKVLFEEVERLKEKMRRLGEVNTMAVEEFKELKGRYDVLLFERTDLLGSIENLQDAIEHINKTSETRFNQAFHAIKDRFERLFPIIFGGGSAELSLTYPEGVSDILDAGVDIHAQPPGKKVVNIGLLSGGEKALTAISLIFAIFMVKPSPFCILDEVDAPLDDSNVGKFNALLKEMSSKTQFIVITHNKKTMELNDTLYGVTMEEPGVSKIVSVELT